jgi:N-acetylglutamate synthase-like GNAT family acetyltransferase
MEFVDRDATEDELKYIYDDFVKIEIGLGIPQTERRRYSYVAEYSGEIVGFVSGLTSNKWLLLSNMWVKQGYRRKGTGTRLIMMFEERVRAAGIEHIYTWMMNTRRGNENDFVWTIGCGNEYFYGKMGYSAYTVIKDFFGAEGIHHVGYRKDILLKPNKALFGGENERIQIVEREITQSELGQINELMKQERQTVFPRRKQDKYSRVIADKGEIIGYAAGYTDYEWFVLTDMWVKSEYRRQGLGSELLLFLVKKVKDTGILHIYTWTMGQNNARYYESLGYTSFAVLENFFEVEGINHIGYRKDL